MLGADVVAQRHPGVHLRSGHSVRRFPTRQETCRDKTRFSKWLVRPASDSPPVVRTPSAAGSDQARRLTRDPRRGTTKGKEPPSFLHDSECLAFSCIPLQTPRCAETWASLWRSKWAGLGSFGRSMLRTLARHARRHLHPPRAPPRDPPSACCQKGSSPST